MSIPASPPLGLETLGQLHGPLVEHDQPTSASALRAVAGGLLLGLAAGHRSMMPLAALALGSSWGGRRARVVTTALAVGELIADKLPLIPDRTRALPALVRALSGAAAGAVAARRGGRPSIAGALVGAAAAIATTRAGLRLRRAADAVIPPAVAASVEDICAAAMALGGASLSGAPITRASCG